MCTQVQNELPYLVEHIEYMRVLGVNRIVVCDDRSTDNTTALQELYASRGRDYLVVWPAPAAMHGQSHCYNKCLEEFRNDTDWFLVLDVDEFVYPANHTDLPSYLATLHPNVSQVTAYEMRYGSSGALRRSQNDIVRKDDGRLVYTNPRGELELLTQEHVHRGPNWRVGEPEPEMRAKYENCSRTACNGWPLCNNGEGKSFARTAHLNWLAVHLHGIADGTEWIRAGPDEVRVYHHYTRSAEDSEIKTRIWQKCDPQEVYEGADGYWSSIEDPVLRERFGKQLRERLADLQS